MEMPPEIEADALPDEREMAAEGVLLAFAARAQDDHPRRVGAAAPDRQEHPHPELRGADLVDDVDPEAVGGGDRRASSARTSGLTSLAARLARRRVRLVPSPMMTPRSAAAARATAIRSRGHQDQLVEGGRRRLRRGAVDGGRIEAPLDDAAREQLDAAAAPPSSAAARSPIQIASAWTGRPREAALDGRPQVHDGLAVELGGGPGPDRQEAADRQVAGRGEGRRVPRADELAEGGLGAQLAAAAPVELAEGALEGGLGRDGDGQDVGPDVPGLVGDDAQLHASGGSCADGGVGAGRGPAGCGQSTPRVRAAGRPRRGRRRRAGGRGPPRSR